MTFDLVLMAREANADHVKTLATVMKDDESLIAAIENETKSGQEAALKAAQKLADDKAYTTDHKAKKIAELVAIETAKTAAAVEVVMPLLENKARTYAAAASDRIDPTTAPILNYLKDALTAQLEGQPNAAILAAWEQAIETGDKHAARVLRDFAPRLLRASPESKSQTGSTPLFPTTRDLERKTADLLMTDDQRAAQAALERLKAAQARVQALARNNHTFGMTKIVNGQLKVGVDALQTGVRL